MAIEPVKLCLPQTISSFSHDELIAITSSVLKEVLSKDEYLCDLPLNATLDEINNYLAVLHGKSIAIDVMRGGNRFPVIVPQKDSRVSDLKRGIKRSVNLEQERCHEGKRRRQISWKYVWKTYNLAFEETILDNNDTLLSEYGIINHSIVHFVKKLREKRKRLRGFNNLK